MDDLNDIAKVRNFYDVMGYLGYTSGKEEDRKKLYVTGVKPLYRKKDNKLFGYSLFTKSIGSGKESRFTVFYRIFDKDPVKEGDIIWEKELCDDCLDELESFFETESESSDETGSTSVGDEPVQDDGTDQ